MACSSDCIRCFTLLSLVLGVSTQLSQPISDDSEVKPNKYQALSPLKAEQIIL